MSFIAVSCFLLALLSAYTVSAQTNTTDPCIDPDFFHLNASDSATIPAPRAAGFDGAATWTVGTGVTEVRDYAANNSFVKQTWWLKTNPVIKTDPASLPFEGCIFMYRQGYDQNLQLELQLTGSLNTANGNTNCSTVLPSGCSEAISKQLAFSAADRASRYNFTQDKDFCMKLTWSYPDACKGVFSSGFQFLYGPFGLTNYSAPPTWLNGNYSRACNRTSSSVFDGSASQNWFYDEDSNQYGTGGALRPLNISIGNTNFYDFFVQRTMAVMMVTWSRNARTIEPEVSSVCLTPQNHVEASSRNPARNAAVAISAGRGGVLSIVAMAAFVMVHL